MRFKDPAIFILIFIILMCIVGAIYSIIYFGPDSYLEEKIEAMIKNETGQDIDLTPMTQENAHGIA